MCPFESAKSDSVWASRSSRSVLSRSAHGSTGKQGSWIMRSAAAYVPRSPSAYAPAVGTSPVPDRDAPLRAALFDVDGVLVDSPHERAWSETLDELMQGAWRDV